MNAQQAEEFVNLIAAMQTSEENPAAGNCDAIGIFDDLIVTARQIAAPPTEIGDTPEQLRLMAAEWEAWRNLARKWPQHRPDINQPENTQLLLAIRMWGEELVALRLTQTPEILAKARVMYAGERRV